jgi:hypothetical protein
MACTACGAESPAGARFCMHCAAPLPLACAACEAAVPKDARFCPQCAHPTSAAAVTAASSPSAPARSVASYTPKHLADKILTSRSALEGERKQVTVLFADVKGSLELAERALRPTRPLEPMSRLPDGKLRPFARGASARREAAEVEEALWTLDHFARQDVAPLRRALRALGRSSYVPGDERDALLIAARQR